MWGQCIYVHEFANAVGLSDGNMSANNGRDYQGKKAIYAIRGIHEIGFKNLKDQERTIYFDLTSKPYVFTKGDANNAVMEGVIVIDKERGTSIISELYQCTWDVDTFVGDESFKQHIWNKIQNQFLKKKINS